jgi:transitional endoplasmic reticulum ATPase
MAQTTAHQTYPMFPIFPYSLYPPPVTLQALNSALATTPPSALRESVLSKPTGVGWESVGGDAGGAKGELQRAVEWPILKRDEFKKFNLKPPRGILLYGPPGCAKTTLAKACANAANVAFMTLTPADVYAAPYVGDAEAVIRRAFKTARVGRPCVLFFDEIDSIVGGGSDNNEGGGTGMGGRGDGKGPEARVMSTFLNEMDGVDMAGDDGVLVLGATNRPNVLDAALLRAGR